MDKLITRKKEVSKSFNEMDNRKEEYLSIINIYALALNKIETTMKELQKEVNRYSGYEVISNVTSRIKIYDSIINKMKRRNYHLTYKELIDNINDIAGLRIICMSEVEIYKIVNIISNMKDINILKEKDYIKKSKKSGYSAYHLIVEVPINIKEKEVWVKVEIQIRTIAMDFWANVEHKVKYKSSSKVSKKNSNKLKLYATIISKISRDMTKMYKNSYKYIEN